MCSILQNKLNIWAASIYFTISAALCVHTILLMYNLCSLSFYDNCGLRSISHFFVSVLLVPLNDLHPIIIHGNLFDWCSCVLLHSFISLLMHGTNRLTNALTNPCKKMFDYNVGTVYYCEKNRAKGLVVTRGSVTSQLLDSTPRENEYFRI